LKLTKNWSLNKIFPDTLFILMLLQLKLSPPLPAGSIPAPPLLFNFEKEAAPAGTGVYKKSVCQC